MFNNSNVTAEVLNRVVEITRNGNSNLQQLKELLSEHTCVGMIRSAAISRLSNIVSRTKRGEEFKQLKLIREQVRKHPQLAEQFGLGRRVELS